MTDNQFTRRDWITAVTSTLAAAGLQGCGESPAPSSSLAAQSPFAGKPKSDRPNIVIFLSDTLRADHLSCYGYTPQTSQIVDEFAREGVLFERCTSGSTWTKPSISTLFTGVPARVHQSVIAEGGAQSMIELEAYRVQVLRDEFQTLASTLKLLGYKTAHFVGNAHCRPEFGYGRGFDHVVFDPVYYVGQQISDAFNWISKNAHEPFFVVIHQIDPHGPYTPPDAFFFELHGVTKEEAAQEMATTEAENMQRFLESYGNPAARAAVAKISPEANRYLTMLYDAEIHAVNVHFRRLINRLKRMGVFDHTVVAFTSDHGEGFDEHGFYGHAPSLAYQELVHVPLIMGGGGLPAGVRIPHSVSMIDLYPTLIELAGGTSPDYVTGSPMISRSGEVLVNADRIAFTDLDHRNADQSKWDASVIDGRYKVASRRRKNEHWIFDLFTDPGEKQNLSNSGALSAEKERSLIATLNTQIERYETLREQFGEPVWMEASDTAQEELQALGYI